MEKGKEPGSNYCKGCKCSLYGCTEGAEPVRSSHEPRRGWSGRYCAKHKCRRDNSTGVGVVPPLYLGPNVCAGQSSSCLEFKDPWLELCHACQDEEDGEYEEENGEEDDDIEKEAEKKETGKRDSNKKKDNMGDQKGEDWGEIKDNRVWEPHVDDQKRTGVTEVEDTLKRQQGNCSGHQDTYPPPGVHRDRRY